jgi:carboxymethylenebutenolidase
MAASRSVPVPCDDAGSMPLHVWIPAGGSGPGILVIQEIFGVGPYIRSVAERLMNAGYVVGAPEVFWRFAPGWEAGHDQAGLEASIAKVGQLDAATAALDCSKALATLGELDEVEGRPAVIGFCLGGTLAWAVAAGNDPAACVSYYGSGVPDMLDEIDNVTCPTLLHFGDADAYIPNERVEALAAAISGHDRFTLNVESAGHAFDNHESEMFYDERAAVSAWSKTMTFLSEHLPTG